MRTTRTLLLGALLAVIAASPAMALNNVFVVHGINGKDLGADPALPVDIAVNGTCALPNVPFGAVAATKLDPGLYEVAIYAFSDGNCKGTLAITSTVDIAAFERSTLVAHLTEQGTPKITKFVDDIRGTKKSDWSRLQVRHGAAEPRVDVVVYEKYSHSGGKNLPEAEAKHSHFYSQRFTLRNIENSAQRSGEVPAATYDVMVIDRDSRKTIAELKGVTIPANLAIIAYAVGSSRNGTFQVVIPTEQITPINN